MFFCLYLVILLFSSSTCSCHFPFPSHISIYPGCICEPLRSLSMPKPPAHTWSRIRDSPCVGGWCIVDNTSKQCRTCAAYPSSRSARARPRSSNTRSCRPETSSPAAPCFEGLDRFRIVCGIISSTLIIQRWIRCDALGREGRLISESFVLIFVLSVLPLLTRFFPHCSPCYPSTVTPARTTGILCMSMRVFRRHASHRCYRNRARLRTAAITTC